MPGDRTPTTVAHLVQGAVLRRTRLAWIYDSANPQTDASREIVAKRGGEGIRTAGVTYDYAMVMTQTCDLLRTGPDYEFITVCPVIKDSDKARISRVEAGHEPKAVPVPWHEEAVSRTAIQHEGWIALPSLAVSMERAVASNTDTAGMPSEAQRRVLAEHLGRFYSRAAIPGEVVDMLVPLTTLAKKREGKASAEGAVFRAVKQIRLQTSPDYDAPPPWEITVLFIVDPLWLPDSPKKRRRPQTLKGSTSAEQLTDLITGHRATADQETATRLWRSITSAWLDECERPDEVSTLQGAIRTQLTPHEYTQSDFLDLNYLSTYRKARASGDLTPDIRSV